MTALSAALKEWHVAVNALAAGQTIALLRKGGIREQGGRFRVKHDRVLLYPTYEHQKQHLLKSEYAKGVVPVEPGWHPATVEISAWAAIDEIIAIDSPQTLTHLFPFHIWTEDFATERFNWKPSQPLYLLLLRTYALPHIVSIPYLPEYGGCRSWIQLAEEIPLTGSVPVLEDDSYRTQVSAIQAAISTSLSAVDG